AKIGYSPPSGLGRRYCCTRDGDGIDPLGFPMEGWAEGDMHGAYEVVMPLDGLDQAVAGFVGWGLGFSVPVVIIGGLIFRFVLRNQVGGPLANTVNRMREIAEGDGDLTQRLPEKSKDEIGDLARAFNGFVGKIHDVIAAVVRDSTEMANQSTSLVASGKQTSSQLNASQMEGQQISAAAQELAASATEVSQRSTHAQEHSVRSGQLAGEGGSSVEQLVQEVEGISEAVSEAGETIERLAGRSSDIGSVIDVINEIADQTNLLALNAAIEAARAGEHGRGFAVVSDEVRKLADRTTAATEDISGLVKAIQEEANSAKERMTSSMDLVTSGRAKASSAGEGLSAILESTSGVRESVDSIAAAAEQQAAASDQVSESILKVVKTMTDAATTSDKLSAALESLSGKATRMRGEMNRFKLRDDRENGTGAGS
ncbi:MAG: methyl-accepting chemotaxis protein, partial [Planctomycetota bacterium]